MSHPDSHTHTHIQARENLSKAILCDSTSVYLLLVTYSAAPSSLAR
jgi:hypothetical protein